jgi:hypothetical protein
MTRADLVLAVLAAAGGQPYTPAQIQKAIFIICDQYPYLISEGPGFAFKPHNYGPFDSDVYFEIDKLARDGLARVFQSPFGNWNMYAATAEGENRGRAILCEVMADAECDYVETISTWVRSLNFSKLVKSIYEAYPHMRANSIFRG